MVGLVVTASVLLLALLVVAYGTVVRNRWGINLQSVTCPCCHDAVQLVRKPKSLRQALWGGWTCGKCGHEMDKWGRRITS